MSKLMKTQSFYIKYTEVGKIHSLLLRYIRLAKGRQVTLRNLPYTLKLST
jgi:hypothetical protein